MQYALRFRFHSSAGSKLAALAAVVCWLDLTQALPMDALWAALEARFGDDADSMKAKLQSLLQAV